MRVARIYGEMQRNDSAIQVCVERETKARSGMYGKVITKALMSKGTVKFLITAKRVLRRPKRVPWPFET